MKKYFVGYTNNNTKLTIYRDRYDYTGNMSNVFGNFDVTQSDHVSKLADQLNIAFNYGVQSIRNDLFIALGLKL